MQPEATVRELVRAHFAARRYVPVSESELNFTRGSARLTPIAFSPKQWAVRVAVNLVPVGDATQVNANFDVDTTGQLVSKREESYWQAEADNLVRTLGGSSFSSGAEANRNHRVAFGQNLLVTILAIAVAFGAGLGGLLLATVFPERLPRAAALLILPMGLGFGGLWLVLRLTQKWLGSPRA